MRAEIITIGTELLLGRIVNSNAAYLAAELASLGIDCYYQTVVGDNPERLQLAFKSALNRADILITTGGLGPTPDDLTVSTTAQMFEQPLILDEEQRDKIEAFFLARGKQASENNIKQALRPEDAEVIPNPLGTAPGIIWHVENYARELGLIPSSDISPKLIICLPGVPREMKAMWQETVVPYLRRTLRDSNILYWRELKFYGIGESEMAQQLADLMEYTDPTFAPYTGRAECRLRIATKAADEENAFKRISPFIEIIQGRLGKYIYGFNDDSLEKVVAEQLRNTKQTLAIAESCTGGLLSQRLTEIPGSSAYTRFNVVTYSNNSKSSFLNVKRSTLRIFGAVSKQVALQMAIGIRQLNGTDYGISITGVAGPTGDNKHKPVGLVFIALVGKDIRKVYKCNFGAMSREEIRWRSTQEALNILRINCFRSKLQE